MTRPETYAKLFVGRFAALKFGRVEELHWLDGVQKIVAGRHDHSGRKK